MEGTGCLGWEGEGGEDVVFLLGGGQEFEEGGEDFEVGGYGFGGAGFDLGC